MTTRELSVSVPVSDQDAALTFSTEVLGCELRMDVKVRPGARPDEAELVRMAGGPPMFAFAAPSGNGLAHLKGGES